MKGEYFLPFVVDELLQEKKATVKVLKSEDKWYGVTYKEDKPMVMTAIQNLKDQGLYPQKLGRHKWRPVIKCTKQLMDLNCRVN